MPVVHMVMNGNSSTDVTPSALRYLIAASLLNPAYVPRSFSGTSGCSLVNPLTLHLVDDRFIPGNFRATIVSQVNASSRNGRQGREFGVVALVERQILLRIADVGNPTSHRPIWLAGRAPWRRDRA